MHKIVLVSVLLVCATHGRRAQPSAELAESRGVVENQEPAISVETATDSQLDRHASLPIRAFLNLLVAGNPEAAFAPSSHGVPLARSSHATAPSTPVALDRRASLTHLDHVDRFGHQSPRMTATYPPAKDAPKDKLYKSKEFPKLAGGLKVGTRRVTVITGSSSGLGLKAMIELTNAGHFVIAGVRDTEKMEMVAKENGISTNNYVAMKLELASLQSVKDFVDNIKAFLPLRPINNLICNAAVYRPTDQNPAWTDDGFEMSLGINHLGHFLLVQLLLPELSKTKGARCVIVGSVTGNSNTIGGGLVRPRAEVGNLEGLKAGGNRASAMVSSISETFDGAKAYKDAKALNMMTALEMHRRYHDSTGVVFSSIYPGCITDTNLFREKKLWFRTYWPKLMRFVGSYVSEKEAGERLAQVILDPKCSKSGVYWGWNGAAQNFGRSGAGGAGGEINENEYAPMIADPETGRLMWEYSMDAVKDYL